MTTAVTWYSEGVVNDPASFDIVEGNFTQIMLPLDRSDLTLASELAADIGEGVTSVSIYSGGWQQYIVGNPGDFAIAIGDGILVNSTIAYPGWNSPVVRNQTRLESQHDNVATKEIKE
jgi:hypothetical protein